MRIMIPTQIFNKKRKNNNTITPACMKRGCQIAITACEEKSYDLGLGNSHFPPIFRPFWSLNVDFTLGGILTFSR